MRSSSLYVYGADKEYVAQVNEALELDLQAMVRLFVHAHIYYNIIQVE